MAAFGFFHDMAPKGKRPICCENAFGGFRGLNLCDYAYSSGFFQHGQIRVFLCVHAPLDEATKKLDFRILFLWLLRSCWHGWWLPLARLPRYRGVWTLLELRNRGLVMVEQPSFRISCNSKNVVVPTNGTKLLEHSFPRMTWQSSIGWYADGWMFVYRLALLQKRKNRIRVADGVSAMEALMPKSMMRIPKMINNLEKTLYWEKYEIPWKWGRSSPFIGVWWRVPGWQRISST